MNDLNPVSMSWQEIGAYLVSQAESDRKVYLVNGNMNAAARGLLRGIYDVEQTLKAIDFALERQQALLQAKDGIVGKRQYYLNLPGEDGAWECTVLSQAEEKIDELLSALSQASTNTTVQNR